MSDVHIETGPWQFDNTATFTATAVFSNPPTTYADGVILALGTSSDIAFVERASILNANTTLTGVIVGTPVTPAVAADSLIQANKTADGDMLFATQTGGNSHAFMWYDTSAAILRLYAGAGVEAIKLDNGVNTHTGTTRMAGAGAFGFGAAESVTISGGVATCTKRYVILAGEGATTDTLDSITFTGQAAGDILILSAIGGYTITADNSATMLLGAGTRALTAGGQLVLLATSATVWTELVFLTAAS